MLDVNFYFAGLSHYYRKKSVLVVEDDLLLKPYLARIFYSVDPKLDLTWVSSADEARKLLETTHFHLVVSDCLLPEGDSGIILLHECRKRFPETPVLMITSLTPKELRRRSRGIPFSVPFMQKPFSATECKDMIEGLLRDR